MEIPGCQSRGISAPLPVDSYWPSWAKQLLLFQWLAEHTLWVDYSPNNPAVPPQVKQWNAAHLEYCTWIFWHTRTCSATALTTTTPGISCCGLESNLAISHVSESSGDSDVLVSWGCSMGRVPQASWHSRPCATHGPHIHSSRPVISIASTPLLLLGFEKGKGNRAEEEIGGEEKNGGWWHPFPVYSLLSFLHPGGRGKEVAERWGEADAPISPLSVNLNNGKALSRTGCHTDLPQTVALVPAEVWSTTATLLERLCLACVSQHIVRLSLTLQENLILTIDASFLQGSKQTFICVRNKNAGNRKKAERWALRALI